MSRQTDWLQSEIKKWMREGLIDQSTGQLLAARYPAASGGTWGFSLITAIGAIVFGLGVILFFAYNWADLPKIGKLAMIFVALLAFHLLGWYQRPPGNRNLSEGFHLIGTMLFGAGIFLIAQIYHIDEHYPNALVVWGAGALLFAWVLPSVIQGIIATFLIGAWGLSEVFDFGVLHITSVGLLCFAVLPLAWMQRSRVLLAIVLVATLTVLLANVGRHVDAEIVAYLLLAVSVLLIATSYLTAKTGFPESADVLRFIGAFVYCIIVFAMTFLPEFTRWSPQVVGDLEIIMVAGLLGSAAVLWVGLCLYGLKVRFDVTKSMQHGLILLTVIVLIAQAFGVLNFSRTGVGLIYDVILSAHCVLLIIRGTDNLKWKQVVIGCLVLGTVIFARFNDLFHSLLVRSLVFLCLGAMLFLIGHLYSKRKQRELDSA